MGCNPYLTTKNGCKGQVTGVTGVTGQHIYCSHTVSLWQSLSCAVATALVVAGAQVAICSG
jgi:hypothetical protein